MIKISYYDSFDPVGYVEKLDLLNFLYTHLEEYGDPKKDIERAIEYSQSAVPSSGGFLLIAREKNDMVGAVVMNQTGMKGYIPENILVYIATHKEHRGKGIGKKLMEEAIRKARGSVALHVEADNPALKLYEKYGFQNKYLEMRLEK